jgi:predicted nuclease of predicted toxin-antitoxin system
VIVTDDTDFLRIAALTTEHPGVVFCRRTRHTIGEIINFVILIHELYSPDDMVGRVEYL